VYHRLLPLIEALELVCKTEENLSLLLVGVGPHRSELEREVERRRLTGKVRFLGQLSHSSLPSFLSGIDCFVSLIPKSGISISLLEAAASAKVIIAFTPDDALDRFFTPGKNIYSLNTLAPNEIANAIKIIHGNSKLKDNLAKGAREIAQRHFSEQVVSRQLQELFRKIYEDEQSLREIQ
jgi:glycosyltransferase involved in cell wall biosynthesis